MTTIVLHLHTQHCTNCGAQQRYSQAFLATMLGRTRRLAPVLHTSELYAHPFEFVRMAPRAIPFCDACVSSLAISDAESAARWQDTLRRKALSDAAPAAPAPAARNETIDDL